MKIEEMIEKLRYKANNIKAKIEPEFFNEVADVLEKQVGKDTNVSSKNDGWISVDDRLPEIREDEEFSDKVLLFTEVGEMFVGDYTEYKWYNTIYKEWYSYGTGGRRMKPKSKVIAWMPLPSKYISEE